jgi:hypothetical protein
MQRADELLALPGTDGPMPGQMDRLLGQGIGHVAGQTRTIRGEDRAFLSVATVGPKE